MAEPNRSRLPAPSTFETPLVSSRTLQSAAATSAASSRLPLRQEARTGVTMTAPRLRAPLAGSTGAAPTPGASRLMLRRPSVSDPPPSTLPRPGSVQPTLKRTSSIAGLSSDPEVSAAKRQLSSAQHELADLKHTHTRDLLTATTHAASLQAQLDEATARADRLERQRASQVAKEREADERALQARGELEKERGELQVQARKAKLELAGVRDELAEVGGRLREVEHEGAQAKAKARAEKGRADALEEELERMREELREKGRELGEEQERRRAVETELAGARASQADLDNAEVVKEELHRQVTHLRALEKENGKLVRRLETFEKQHANLEILREANKALEKKVRSLDALRRQAASSEAEVEALKREKREWQSFLGPEPTAEFSSPRKLTKTLAAARIENATFREKIDTQELEVHKRDRIVGELEARIAALEQELARTATLLGKAEARAKQEEGRQQLHLKEIEMLNRHLATYTTEAAMDNQSAHFEAQKGARLVELEELLEAHKVEVARLTKDVAHYQGLVERYGGSTTEIHDLESEGEGGGGGTRPGEDDTGVIVTRSLRDELAKNEALQGDLDALRNDNALMEKEIEALELQVDRLTYEHGQGAYDPRTTKVLELRDNPDTEEHAIRTATLERLRDENEALLRALAGAGGTGAGTAMVPRQSLVNARKELEAAEARVKQKETMELRLKKAFSDKADEFRKAVQSLLGFRLDFLSSGRVKVSSIYCTKREYALLFSSAAGGVGTMELLGIGKDELGEELQTMNRFWVGEKHCIPGFLASLSLTLFDREQQEGGRG